MAQKRSNNHQFRGRRTGTERRGTIATPLDRYIGLAQEQSTRDRRRLLEKIRLRHEEAKQLEGGIGNKTLPVFNHKSEIIETIEQHKAVIIGGETGSGKSTQIPQYLYEAGYDKTFVLVPRRVIANGLYDRLNEELSEQLGDVGNDVVGVIHGERVEYDEERNKIVVMTPQTFSKMEAELRRRYADNKIAIITDEIHEANLNSEIAAGIAGSTVSELDNWRLIASSATHDLETLKRPFSKINNGVVPSIQIEGRPFTYEVREEPHLSSMDLYAEVGDDYEKTIIFTSGKKEIDFIIEKTRQSLERKKRGSASKVIFRKLHGELTEVELAQINDPIPEDCRLVIVSSPAGNSGITIPGTQLVITDGTVNRAELDHEGTPGLVRHQASIAEITQQMGRAGRDVVGGVAYLTKPVDYRDYDSGKNPSESTLCFESILSREKHAPADIYSTRLGRTALEVAGIGRRMGDINSFLPHAVTPSAISQAEELLVRIGALNGEVEITPIGMDMNRFALSPELSRGVVEVKRQGRPQQQLARIALMAAAIEVGGLQDYTDKNKTNWKQLLSVDIDNDYSAQLELFNQVGITEEGRDIQWMREHDLHPKRIQQARKLAGKILGSLKMDPNNITLNPISYSEQQELFRDATAGMIDFIHEPAGKSRQHEILYRNIHGHQNSTRRKISNRSMLSGDHKFVAGFPRWFINKRDQYEHIIELNFPVNAADVAEFAELNNVLGSRLLAPALRDDRVVEMEQPSFGSIDVGEPRVRVAAERIPAESQKLLLKLLNDNPGREQRSLIDIAKTLDHYKRRLPEGEFETYLRKGHPDIITHNYIQDLLQGYVQQYRSKGEIEEQIRLHIYKERIGIDEYLEQDAINEINRRSPNELSVPGFSLPLLINYSDNADPYISSIRPADHKRLKGPIYLKDGREVLIQVSKPDRGVYRVSAVALMGQ